MVNNDEINYISKIQFTIFSNNNIIDNSSITEKGGITIPETYESGEPKRNGLVDTRLGVTDGNLECAFCGLNANQCPGHFGHTVLNEPVFHFGLLNNIKNILSCICLKSSKLLINLEDQKFSYILNFKKKKRFLEIKKHCSMVQITDVGVQVPNIKIDIKNSIINIIAEYNISNIKIDDELPKKKIKEVLNATDIYNIFKNISDIDWINLGFDPQLYRPEDMLIINLPIPPVTIRPSLNSAHIALTTFEDSLVHNFIEIVKTNNKIIQNKDKINTIAGNKYNTSLTQLLSYLVHVVFDNESLTLPTNELKIGGRPTKSISERLKGKTGRIRGNLMGKRVDFSARTVITSDPNIQINEVGVPLKIAMNLTFPIIVTNKNKDYLQSLVNNGRKKYPGANYVKKKKSVYKNNTIDLRYSKYINLEIGDEVHRHLINGDFVLFNRQPSLHKLSMMAHKVMIINDPNLYTFRVNVSATPPYNADFDGDEMNIHVPQSIETHNELEKIANLNNQIFSPGNSKPIITFVQDSVLATYIITDNITVNWRQYMNLLTYCDDISINNIEKKDYSGKQLYSNLIPNGININKGGIKIINGNILQSSKLIDKRINQLIVGNIWHKYGADKTSTYIFNVQRLISNWLLQNGFSVSLKDITIPNILKMEIIKEIEKKKMEICHLITEIENNPELIDADTFEDTVRNNLSSHKGVIEKLVMNELDNTNNFYVMAKSGSKGKGINIMQMCGSLGQEIIEFERAAKTVNGRALPHFFQNDDRAESRGYIIQSYYDGLDPFGFYFHHQGAKIGIIDTAVKTRDTGYMARKIEKAEEDISIKYDRTVRNSSNKIIQFSYGDNGIDQIKQTMQYLSLIEKSDVMIKTDYCFTSTQIKELENKFKIKNLSKYNDKYTKLIIYNRDLLRKVQQFHIQNYITLIDNYASPVNFKRLIQDILNFKSTNDNKENINPLYIYEKIDHILLNKVTQILNLYNTELKLKDESDSKLIFKLFLYEYISPKKIIYDYKLTKYNFDILVNQIIDEFNKGLVEPGEMVGSLGAQHIGEPSTQMTLNTFHSTGSGVVGMQGVPRLREIISITKNNKTPTMEIYLEDSDYKSALLTKSYIEHITLSKLITNYSVIFDTTDTAVKQDKVSNIYNLNITNNNNNYDNLPFIMKFDFDKTKLIQNSLTLFDIKTSFISFWKKNFINIKLIKRNFKDTISNILNCGIMSNNDNSDNLIIHIRFNMRVYNFEYLENFKNIILNNYIIKGINNITNVYNPVERQIIKFKGDGSILKESEHMLNTDGINMIDIGQIKGIDLNRTYCNNIYTIYNMFGVEAARNCLLKELTTVFISSGNDVNYHHLSLLVDLITHSGILISIDRHGLVKLDNDPLSKASFEKTVDILLQAAIYNEVDSVNSVSSRIMCGRTFNGGTCAFDLMMDNEMIMNSELINVDIDKDNYKLIFTENNLLKDIISRDTINSFIP
tara:strand:+ start:4112 stop:8506 length:4395 start_codon:yes stop_codon:yes gene_type:complete